MKNLKLTKGLSRNEMKSISGGKAILMDDQTCTCGTNAPVDNVQKCTCTEFCANNGCKPRV